MSDKIVCKICGAQEHVIKSHLAKAHSDYTLERYQEEFPGAPVMSQTALDLLSKKMAERKAAEEGTTMAMAGSAAVAAAPVTAANVTSLIPKNAIIKKALHEVFELGAVKAAMSQKGDPIMISTITPGADSSMVPPVSDGYVYDIDELKDVILALEMNIPLLVWGHKGSGKSELVEQTCARTGRSQIRVQHTVNTEESHILGQYVVKNGGTEFELGPLPIAMMNGWVYTADEYDFGMPSVLAVYQSVLEGKSLVIKEAPPELRVIKPHKDFRFTATGNTNGSGDESGLYQGTLIQNSANYDRFGMVIHKQYMDQNAEIQILMNQARLAKPDAEKMVKFATLVRESYDGAKMSDTISPRTLIYAARIGIMRGSFRHGIAKSFISKLSKIDRQVADGLAQRIFGA